MNKGKVARLGLVGLGNWAHAIAHAIMKSKKIKLVTCLHVHLRNAGRSAKSTGAARKKATKLSSKGMISTVSFW